MKHIAGILVCLFCITVSTHAQNLNFDKDVYEKWINLRAGNGKKPVYWYCYGEVYSYPEGKMVAKMEGIDVSTVLPVSEDSMVQLNRKIFLYLDKETGKILDTLNGQIVNHIKYPYQVIEYVRTEDDLVTYVTQGAGNRVNRLGPSHNAKVKKVGSNMVFSFPAFVNFQTAKGKYEAYENFDFFLNSNASRTAQRYQLTWWRYGELPAFLGGGRSVIQLVSHRVAEFEELPEQLRRYIEENAPMWKAPPQDMAEVRRLQGER